MSMIPPHLVLPLTVEPTKPRLCIDARFLNLWMKDMPFSLDKLSEVTRYVYPGSFMTKCDDKSGYDHVMLKESSQSYFGFSFGGLWFVCTTLPFGWKISPYVYHTIGLAATGFLRAQGIHCSLYIDDRFNGELLRPTGPWSILPADRSLQFRLLAATGAIFVVLSVLVNLGYTIGIKKSVLVPVTSLEYLGLIVDSVRQPFLVPRRKIESWALIREKILACKKTVWIKTLQRFQGKCISFSLAVPAAKLFIREMSRAIASGLDNGQVYMTDALREEISHWRYLADWKDTLPWRDEKHVRIAISTDASGYGWGCAVHSPSDDQIFRDYWTQEELCLDISSREMLALVYAIKALPDGIRDCRIDASIDSMAVLGAWQGSGSRRSPQLTSATKRLYFALSSRNVQLNLSYVPSKENVADFPSRTMSRVDSKLSMSAFEMVDKEFGGVEGHSFDLMSLDSNVMKNKDGIPLPHFTPFPSPDSNGVNVFSQDLREFPSMSNPYVFPPFSLIGPLMKFLLSFKIPFTIVVPEFVPHRYWWVELNARCSGKICLGTQGDLSVLLSPSKSGYSPTPCPFSLWAFRVSRF